MNGKQMSVMKKFMFIRNYLTFDSFSLKRWCKLESSEKRVYFFLDVYLIWNYCLFSEMLSLFGMSWLRVCLWIANWKPKLHCLEFAQLSVKEVAPLGMCLVPWERPHHQGCCYPSTWVRSDLDNTWRPAGRLHGEVGWGGSTEGQARPMRGLKRKCQEGV